MKEIFKEIENYEGLYQVSNLGRVKSLAKEIVRPIGSYFVEDKILKPLLGSSGYYQVVLYNIKKGKTIRIHQLVAQAFLDYKIGGKLVVNHKNFNKLNNQVDNLEVISQRENTNLKHLPSSSKYVGVSFFKRDNKWRSAIRINGKNKHLGHFNNELDASNAYQKALKELKT